MLEKTPGHRSRKGSIGAVLVVVGLFLGFRAFDEARQEQHEAKTQQEANELVEDLADVPRGYIDVEDDEDYTLAIAFGALGSVTVLSGVILLAASRNED